MTINDRIAALRQMMKTNGLDAYIITSSDPHQSEYPAPHWETRVWISGFTGSAGTVIITKDHAGLWTDSRYFIQAETQLKDSEMVLHKQGIPHAPEHEAWLKDQLPVGGKVGCDGMLFSVGQIRRLAKTFYEKEIDLQYDIDLIPEIWKDRPVIPTAAIFEHNEKYAGLTRSEKLAQVRTQMESHGAQYHLISTLDDIAWLYNLRGKDVACNPVFVSYAIVSEKLSYLFTAASKLSDELMMRLKEDGILIKPYGDIETYLQSIATDQKILVDKSTTSIRLYQALKTEQIIDGKNIVRSLKALKNPTEISHIKQAMLKDGVALTRLYRWLEATLPTRKISEVEVAKKLDNLRAAQGDYHGESFSAIVGYNENGAIVHYRAEEDTCAYLEPKGILLLDSGGQYTNGTTDITRTTALGVPTEEQRRNFTLVLKGHIALATIHFPHGTVGVQMDILARQALWKHHLNYGHGTGHGVGFFLNVHEPPQGIATSITTSRGSTVFEPGMFTSNEPGFYKEGAYGIRIENLILVTEAEENEFGRFLKFDTLTLFPIDLSLVTTELLTADEKDWLNNYHQEVFEKLSPLLEAEEVAWMRNQCRPIV